jgi:hypothetical protein
VLSQRDVGLVIVIEVFDKLVKAQFVDQQLYPVGECVLLAFELVMHHERISDHNESCPSSRQLKQIA